MQRPRKGFTIVELLVALTIMAVIAALTYPALAEMILQAKCSACANHMRGLGIAFISYSMDNNGQLPGRVTATNKWPTLLQPYVGDNLSVYVDPGDPVASAMAYSQLLSNTANNSSFIFNGFNDLGAHDNPNITVNLYSLSNPSQLILLGQQIPGGDNFYMDLSDGDQNTVLKKTAYFGGSNYTFADGSVRFLKLADYSDTLWLVNTSFTF